MAPNQTPIPIDTMDPNMIAIGNIPYRTTMSHLPPPPPRVPVTITLYSRSITMLTPPSVPYFLHIIPLLSSFTEPTDQSKMPPSDQDVFRAAVKELSRTYNTIIETFGTPEQKLLRMKTARGFEDCIRTAFYKKNKHYRMFGVVNIVHPQKVDWVLKGIMRLDGFGDPANKPSPEVAVEALGLVAKAFTQLMEDLLKPGAKALGGWQDEPGVVGTKYIRLDGWNIRAEREAAERERRPWVAPSRR